MKVGVLAVQGAVSEHMEMLAAAAAEEGLAVDVVAVRRLEDLEGLAGIVLPGGESTAISRLLRSTGLEAPLAERARSGDLAVYGTCAGMVLVASEASHAVAEKGVHLLGLLDAEVDRNAFGRQRESFEASADVAGVGTVPTVYIRAPVYTRTWGDTRVLARSDRGIVVAQKGRILASAFHPELTGDLRMHRLFLRMCAA